MLRTIILVTIFIFVNADSTLNSYLPSSNGGFKSYDYGNGNSEKYSKGSSKYFHSGGSNSRNINSGLPSNYPSTIYSDADQGETFTSHLSSGYGNPDNSQSSDSNPAATIGEYSKDRTYAFPSSDYTSPSFSSQTEYTDSSNSQPEFSGRTDYEGSALNDFTGGATQQTASQTYTVGTSYRGSGGLENYPGSQEGSSIRGYGSPQAATGFVASPSYTDSSSNRGIYTTSGFKGLDTSGLRGYPGSVSKEFFGSGKHRGRVATVSSKYPVYESLSSDGYSGNEVEYMPSYSSPHAYSTGNYKRESFNSGGGAHGGLSTSSGFNYLPGSLKGSFSLAGLKSSAYSGGPREAGPISGLFSGNGGHGSEGIKFIMNGGSPSYAPYSSNPSLSLKGQGSAYLSGGYGGNGGSGKVFIIKDSSSGSPHSSSSAYSGGHMFSNSPVIEGSFKNTRGAQFGSQGSSYSYIPSFAGGSSPSYMNRFKSGGHGGGSPYPAYMSAS